MPNRLLLIALLHYLPVFGLNEFLDLHGLQSPQQLFASFRGLARGAQLKISWHELSVEEKQPRFVYIVLISQDQYGDQGFTQESKPCVAPSVARIEIELSNSSNGGREGGQHGEWVSSSGNATLEIGKTGSYSLFLASCDSDVAFHGRLDTSFANPSQNYPQHLSIEDAPLPTLYGILATVYAILVILWAIECYDNFEFVKFVHWCCLAALLLKLMDACSNAVYYQTVDETGKASAALQEFATLSSNLGETAFLFVILMTSLGWFSNPPHLQRNAVAFVAVLFGTHIALISVQTHCNRTYLLPPSKKCDEQPWALTEYVVRSIILLATIIAQNYRFNSERLRVLDIVPPVTPQIALTYSDVENLDTLRWGFLAYLLCPTVLLLTDAVILESNFALRWVSKLLESLFILFIFVPVGSKFAPSSRALLVHPFRTSPTAEY